MAPAAPLPRVWSALVLVAAVVVALPPVQATTQSERRACDDEWAVVDGCRSLRHDGMSHVEGAPDTSTSQCLVAGAIVQGDGPVPRQYRLTQFVRGTWSGGVDRRQLEDGRSTPPYDGQGPPSAPVYPALPASASVSAWPPWFESHEAVRAVAEASQVGTDVDTADSGAAEVVEDLLLDAKRSACDGEPGSECLFGRKRGYQAEHRFNGGAHGEVWRGSVLHTNGTTSGDTVILKRIFVGMCVCACVCACVCVWLYVTAVPW